MWESILQLLDWCRLPLHTTPLLHIILSEVTPSATAVFERFKEAQEELRKTCPTIKETPEKFRRQATPVVDHFNPLLYPVVTHPHNKQYVSQYHSLASSNRYSPYTVYSAGLYPRFRSILAPFDQPGAHPVYAIPMHESPRVLVPGDYVKHDDLKPASPSSVYSDDKSSLSGSVDT
ncbi:uncharacterized protein LOC128983675 isoform X2 [Macrosteles quadrilineatus]|uniref:uncharacterized protein LOC128983675 isoform X2 n=1 Tax=Macrosteles quadrilineatus TaxID=74068 RepID=UPI0023E2664A|nr:uncharacterized protein LOC128983675 isoform X2 [Macrosteles quadrilineatus]